MRRTLALLAVCVALTACGAGAPPPGLSSSGPMSDTQLKLAVLDSFQGDFSYCDPDLYPVGHGTILSNARAHYAQMRREEAEYEAIAAHLGISDSGRPSDADLVRIYDVFKKLAFIHLRRAVDDAGAQFTAYLQHETVDGTVDSTGAVDVQSRTPNPAGCPICLAKGVRIATPRGPVAVERIRVGMAVWSVDRAGRRIRAVVLRTARRAARGVLLRITLADGRAVTVSPGHAAPDGRLIGQLRVGLRLDGARIASMTAVPYRGFTYDLLPSGPTGEYLADGVLLGSTLS